MSAFPEVFHEPHDVGRELAALGLTAEPFQKALRRARLEWATCVEFDGPSFPGTIFWGITLRTLRAELVALGWSMGDPRNLSVVVSPDGMFAIVVETGDDDTGNPDIFAAPATKSPKGVSIADLIDANMNQLDAFRTPRSAVPVAVGGLLTYIFLVRITDGTPHGELSLPEGMSTHGRITRWKQRIVIPMDAGDDGIEQGTRRLDPEPAPDVAVTVTRRAG